MGERNLSHAETWLDLHLGEDVHLAQPPLEPTSGTRTPAGGEEAASGRGQRGAAWEHTGGTRQDCSSQTPGMLRGAHPAEGTRAHQTGSVPQPWKAASPTSREPRKTMPSESQTKHRNTTFQMATETIRNVDKDSLQRVALGVPLCFFGCFF